MKQSAFSSHTRFGATGQVLNRLAFGGSYFNPAQWADGGRESLLDTMHAAVDAGINHFDTAAGYGEGKSEALLGAFLKSRRDSIFLASKSSIGEMDADLMLSEVEHSLRQLDTEFIDLFYIHWPRKGRDLRPLMEGLLTAKERGLIRAIGVSNFSVADMEQVATVGRIDAHQLGYNLLWREAEKQILPYCVANDIWTATYSSIAQGSLTGKFARQLMFEPHDPRNNIVLFWPRVWPHVFAAIEQCKAIAKEIDRPLVHLAIRWVLNQPGANCAVVGARSPAQLSTNAAALEGEIPSWAFERMTEISNALASELPATGNMYDHHP